MPTTSPDRCRAAHTADEQFLELVLADEQFVQEEFDAIVAEEWGPRPPTPRPPWDAPATGPRPHHLVEARGCGLGATRPSHPGAGGWRRQRSPPGTLSHHGIPQSTEAATSKGR